MKIVLKKKSYFTFRGKESWELDLLGISVYDVMKGRLRAEDEEDGGDRAVLYPAYPFLTREELLTYLEEREGSYSFPGGYVVRGGRPPAPLPRMHTETLGTSLFSLEELPAVLSRARRESARFHLGRGALVEEGAEVSFLARLEEGAIVRSGARVLGRSFVGRNAEIGPGSELFDSSVGAETRVLCSVLFGAEAGARCTIGPNAYLRPGSVAEDDCRIGDFVELKNARVGAGSKIAHLAYVGDATLGKRVNVGCGVVFANYDGRKKSRIVVGDGAFLGSNCNLIAPLSVGAGAFVAAGTTLTRDLSAEDFCVGRCRETVKPGRGKRYYNP